MIANHVERRFNQMKRKLIQKRIFLVLLTFVVIFTSGIFMDNTEAEVIFKRT